MDCNGLSLMEPFDSALDYAPSIPGVTFATFQMMFAVITPLLITGAFAERVKFSGFVIFIVAWSFVVYFPLAHWVWGGGWLANLGVYDFAGGIVIHTSAGLASIAAALVLGRQRILVLISWFHIIFRSQFWVHPCFG